MLLCNGNFLGQLPLCGKKATLFPSPASLPPICSSALGPELPQARQDPSLAVPGTHSKHSISCCVEKSDAPPGGHWPSVLLTVTPPHVIVLQYMDTPLVQGHVAPMPLPIWTPAVLNHASTALLCSAAPYLMLLSSGPPCF